MYSDWFSIRNEFKLIENVEGIKDYLSHNNSEIVPCIFRVNSDSSSHMDASLIYSILGEPGYLIWGDSKGSVKINSKGNESEPVGYPFSALFKRYFLSYFRNDGSKVTMVPSLNKLMIGLIHAPSEDKNKSGFIGAGIITDINIDSIRNFRYWKEESGSNEKYWILRFRIKVIWLSRSVRNSIRESIPEIREWLRKGGNLQNQVPPILRNAVGEEIEGVQSSQSNNCYDDSKYINGVKDFIMSKIESGEVEETYKFYKQITDELEDLSQGAFVEEVNSANPQCKSVEEALEQAKDLISNNLYLQNPRILDFMFASLKIGNILLVGPPGVGKTEIATTIADSLCSNGEKVTANALWTRRDLIGGETLREGSISWKPGVILRAYMKASRIPDNTLFPVVLEELNRADIDKAFGDFFTIFSSADSSKWRISSSLMEEIRSFPPDPQLTKLLKVIENEKNTGKSPLSKLRVIATMNLKDLRNLYQIGDAITRRFSVFYLDCPKEDSDVEVVMKVNGFNLTQETLNDLKEVISRVRKGLGSRFCLSTSTVSKVISQISLMQKENHKIEKQEIIELIKIHAGTIDNRIMKRIDKILEVRS